MSYNVAEYVVEWLFFYLQDSEKWWIYLKPFSCYLSTNEKYGYSHTDTEKPATALGENATRYIRLKTHELSKRSICIIHFEFNSSI